MKSLQESLFDDNLASKDIWVDRLLKRFKKKLNKHDIDDIYNFALWTRPFARKHGDVDDIKNPDIRAWAVWFCEQQESILPKLKPFFLGATSKDLDNTDLEAVQWLKPGTIHTEVSWNDRMYSSSLEINWDEWGNDNEIKNITEWIMFQVDWVVFVIVNRKEYDDTSKQLLHALIENVNKFKY